MRGRRRLCGPVVDDVFCLGERTACRFPLGDPVRVLGTAAILVVAAIVISPSGSVCTVIAPDDPGEFVGGGYDPGNDGAVHCATAQAAHNFSKQLL